MSTAAPLQTLTPKEARRKLAERDERLRLAKRAAGAPIGPPEEPTHRRRYQPGGAWVLDVPDQVPAIWGDEEHVLWAQGEPCMIVGPTGVGKSTVAHQLVAGRLGLLADGLLGLPVAPGDRKVLYLASDRPQQIRRAMGRLFSEADREVLDERLVVWGGPPPEDLGKHPERLVAMAAEVGADTVVLDSLKDMALGLSDDEVGAGLNRAMQATVTDGVEVLALHHQRKGQGGAKPRTLEDVYGSTWLVAGQGSVVLLWGAAGDPLVELVHLKQPAETVGPWKIEHDHHAGRSTVSRGLDVLVAVTNAGHVGLTIEDVARLMFEVAKPDENQRKRAGRRLDALVRSDHLRKVEGERGGEGGSQPARFVATARTSVEALVNGSEVAP